MTDYRQFIQDDESMTDWQMRQKGRPHRWPHLIIYASDPAAALMDITVDYGAEVAYETDEGDPVIFRLADGRFCAINNDPTRVRFFPDQSIEVWNWLHNGTFISKEDIDNSEWLDNFLVTRNDHFSKAIQEGSLW